MTHQEWFKRQFGRMPIDGRETDLRTKANACEAKLWRLRRQIEHEMILSARWTASRYAWNVEDRK